MTIFKKFFSVGINRLFIFLLIFVHIPISYFIYQKDVKYTMPTLAQVFEHSSERVLAMIVNGKIDFDSTKATNAFEVYDIPVQIRDANFRKISIDVSGLEKSRTNASDFIRDEFLLGYKASLDSVRRSFTIGFWFGSLFFAVLFFVILQGIRWVILGFVPKR